ncbi:leucine-rich repeat domain-containing protein [Shewanella algae]|uniref:leucine-rich repeat domain-containing protein n=1 Tax=Shewanella algae TaxID=38313 RepID=UPI001AAF01C3|nr:leucine-rich repeat domain-containing protein [Shewanella algae]MBO2577640.1 hypothetical protein [Shewanella algae]
MGKEVIRQKHVGSLTAILGLWLLVVGQVLALSPEEKAAAIIQASPVVQKIKQNFKPEYGKLSFFVNGLTGELGELPSERRERQNDHLVPSIEGRNEHFGGSGSLSRIAVLLDQHGKAVNVVSEKNTTIPPEFLSAIVDARYVHLRRSMFINDKMDLSQFYQLERLSISAVDNVRHIILPQSGRLNKLLISGEEIRLISNLEKQVNLDVLISYVINSSSFNGINKIKSLKFLSIDLSSLNINVGSLKNLEKLRLKNPGYKNIATVHNLDKLRELSIDGMKDSIFKGLALPKNLEKISIYDVKKGSLPKISNLPKLTDLSFLHIEDNILKNMANLPNLKELFGSDVDLPTLDGIDKLPSLVKVNLTNNGTVDISSVASLPNLEGLFVRENDLDNISVIAEMPWLKAVDVSFNRLMSLPKLKPGNNLRRIDFSYNPIEVISPEVLASYSSVRKRAYNTPFYQSLTHEQRRAF